LFTLAYILHLVLCDSVASDAGPASTNNTDCSPRWIVHPRSYGYYYRAVHIATTPRECLDTCVALAYCHTAGLYYRPDAPGRILCRIHYKEPSHQRRGQHVNSVLFDIVRQCYTTPGRLHDLITCFFAKCHAVNSTKLASFLAQLMPLPLTVSCFNKIQIGQRAVKRVCV